MGIVFDTKIKMEFEIKLCSEEFLMNHAEEFADLCVRSFAEHKNRDVRMGPCAMTPNMWKNWAKGCIGQCMNPSYPYLRLSIGE